MIDILYKIKSKQQCGTMLKGSFLACLMVLFFYHIQAQNISAQKIEKPSLYDRFIKASDTLNKKRYTSIAVGSGVLWGGSLLFLNQIWYAQYPRDKFHLYNDAGEWQQVDKVGHAYSSYLGAKLFTTFFKWSGKNEKKSVLLGAGGSLAYLSVIEILDGFSKKWGYSLPDMTANASGIGLYAAQQLLWHDQRIIFKYSTHIQNYYEVDLIKRANNLYGFSTAERIFKDYNAQTYWLSCNVRSFAHQSKWPTWLSLAVGYGAQGMYGGYENTARDDYGNIKLLPNGIAEFERRDITRYRQFYFAPDIDFSKIPWRSKFMRDFTKMVNLKFPFPSLEYNTLGQVKVNALHF
jgi:hypothetical protein